MCAELWLISNVLLQKTTVWIDKKTCYGFIWFYSQYLTHIVNSSFAVFTSSAQPIGDEDSGAVSSDALFNCHWFPSSH